MPRQKKSMSEATTKNIWKNSNFISIFGAHTVSSFGSVVTRDAIPFIAVLFLAAQPLNMSILALAGVIPILLVALPGGVLIDRLPRIPIMLLADIARAGLVLLIPIAWFFDFLTLWVLVGVIFLTTIFSVLFDVANQSVLPEYVEKDELLSANGKLSSADTAAEVTASSLTGWLVQTLGGPIVLLLDSASYLMSAAFILRIKQPAHKAEALDQDQARPKQTFIQDMQSGFKIYAQNRQLKIYLITSATQAFFGAFMGALYVFHLLNTLSISASITGLLIAVGGIGGLLGSVLSEKISNRLGANRVMFYSIFLRSFTILLLPLSVLLSPILVIIALIVDQVLGDFLFVQYHINERTKRQQIAEVHELGRVNSTAHFTSTAAFSLGLLAAGVIGEFSSTTVALIIAASGIFALSIFFKVSYLNRCAN